MHLPIGKCYIRMQHHPISELICNFYEISTFGKIVQFWTLVEFNSI